MKAFDLFGRLPNGRPFWIEAVSDIGAAEKHASLLSETFEGEYFIYSEKEGRIIERVAHG
jgi:hypothetical protein